jgi:low affinity Fe/Cu permease
MANACVSQRDPHHCEPGARKIGEAPREEAHRSTFSDVARTCANALGSPWAFLLASASVVIWALCGPAAGYSEAWQLIINTGTTIITFLMVFLIQNTQNRDSRAIHLKLDELIRSKQAANNIFIDLENCSDQEVEEAAQQFEQFKRSRKSVTASN